MRILAISDIHGCAKTLDVLIEQINLSFEDQLYFLGDYVDRGPDSKGVIDLILSLKEEGYQVHALRGNHEQMMLDAPNSDGDRAQWLINGGYQTIDSYEENGHLEIPNEHLFFLKTLPYYFQVDRFILVHAGLNMRAMNPIEDHRSMLWIRKWYQNIDQQWLGNKIIVHGHTPIPKNQIIKSLDKLDKIPVIDIDAGCVFKSKKGMGHLCAIDLTNMELYFQQNID